MNPVVSVLMTCYNREQYISDAIESVLSSTLTDFELIICDDCSTDRTYEIAKSYAKKDNRIRLSVNAENLGQFQNRNIAASLARGRYLKYLDSDDKFYDFSLQYCVDMMDLHPDADWGLLSFDKSDEGKILTPEKALQTHYFSRPFLFIGPDGSIYRREFFERLGGFSTKYGAAGDVFTNLTAAASGKTLLLTKDFFFYRLHEGQALNGKYDYLVNNYLVQNDILPVISPYFSNRQMRFITKKSKRRFFVNAIRYFKSTGNLSATKKAFQKASFGTKDALRAVFQ